ncbi:hypothetical protein ABFA25_04335 [Mycobacterium lepromatosis]
MKLTAGIGENDAHLRGDALLGMVGFGSMLD